MEGSKGSKPLLPSIQFAFGILLYFHRPGETLAMVKQKYLWEASKRWLENKQSNDVFYSCFLALAYLPSTLQMDKLKPKTHVAKTQEKFFSKRFILSVVLTRYTK